MVPRKVHQKDWQNRISILDLIRQDDTVTTEQLGKLLGISKRAVLKQIDKLKNQGGAVGSALLKVATGRFYEAFPRGISLND
jgi:biotin operon repressor